MEIFLSSFHFDFLQIRTVKVNNISLITSKKDIEEFFSFSGDIQYIEMQRSEHLQCTYLYSFLMIFYCFNFYTKYHPNIWLWFCRETDRTQVAYVTFKNSQGAETAVLLTVCVYADNFCIGNITVHFIIMRCVAPIYTFHSIIKTDKNKIIDTLSLFFFLLILQFLI